MKATLTLIFVAVWSIYSLSAAEFTRAQAGRIAQVVGKLLELHHYKQAPLDNKISEIFLQNYLDALDFNHMVFLQSDLDDLEKLFGEKLDDYTGSGSAGPAFEIFERYLKRLEERNNFVQKVVQEQFDFSSDEKFIPSRNKIPWPKDASEADELWRARIKYELLQGRLAKEKPEETLKTITKRYNRLVKNMREYDSEEILQIYLTALAQAYDPHSDYMTPTEADNFDINNVKLSLSGIGALLRSEDGYAKILSLVPGGPADLSKQLKPKDRIIAVAQGNGEPVDTVEMKLNKVVGMIRGKRGTEVRLTVIPASSPDGSVRKIVPLMRDEIKLTEQYAKANIFDHPDETGMRRRLGVITLPQFYENCSRDVEKLITRLNKENISGLVLDLRRNGGGILQEAIAITGLFIKKGPVVQVKDSRKKTVYEDDDPKIAYDGPLIVLVGHLSASASEIVAAALQDYGRALIVGDQSTHGKGTVQTLQSLNQIVPGLGADAGKIKFTIQKFYRVAGGTTQKYGVAPDITLPSIYDYMDLGEASLPNALEADSTPPADYVPIDRVKSYLADLKDKSKPRIEASTDFAYVLEDIERWKKHRADRSISLNESVLLQEKKEQKARTEARNQERSHRKATGEQVFELNLEMVEKGKPLQPLPDLKLKDGETLAAATNSANAGRAAQARQPKENVNAAEESDGESEDLTDAVTGSINDVHLDETLNILSDYVRLLAKTTEKSTGSLVAKPK